MRSTSASVKIAAVEPEEREAVLSELRATLQEEKTYVKSLIAAHRQLFRLPPSEPLVRKSQVPNRPRQDTAPRSDPDTASDAYLRSLCERATKEHNTWKLIELAQEINRVIERKQNVKKARAG